MGSSRLGLAFVAVCIGLLAASQLAFADELGDMTNRYNARLNAYYDNGANEVYWYHSFKGDCDQNGVVNISDLSRLGAYLHSTVSGSDADKAVAAADCDGNGEVNINDITAMAPNLNKQLVSYKIWVRPDFAPDYPFATDTVVPGQDAIQNYSDATGNPVEDHLRYAIDTTGFEHQWLWVQEVLADGLGRLSKLKMSDDTSNTSIMTLDPVWGMSYDTGTTTLSFYHTMRGDFDQSGTISLNDLLPLGAHLGETGPWSVGSAQWPLDAYRDGVISITDWFTAGTLFFNQSIETAPAGFNVYYIPDIADMPPTYAPDIGILAAHVNVSEGIQLGGRRSYVVPLSGGAAAGTNYIWVRPVTSDGELGARSEVIDTP